MAPKIPNSFGSVKGSLSKNDEARPPEKVPQKTPTLKWEVPTSSQIQKKREVMDLKENIPKKQRIEDAPSDSHSLALTHVGALAYAYVKDKEIKEWQSMSLEESTKACVKASAQLVNNWRKGTPNTIGR